MKTHDIRTNHAPRRRAELALRETARSRRWPSAMVKHSSECAAPLRMASGAEVALDDTAGKVAVLALREPRPRRAGGTNRDQRPTLAKNCAALRGATGRSATSSTFTLALALTLRRAFGYTSRAMQGNELHARVRDKRRQIIEEIEFLLRQLKACDDTLASLPPVPEPSPHEASATAPAEAPPAPPIPIAPAVTPPPPAVATTPVPPPAPSAPVEVADEARFKEHQRGWLMARVEQAVADCGETFTLKQVRAAYEARFGAVRRMRASSIAAALWKLARKHSYKIVRRGTGRAHSVYQR